MKRNRAVPYHILLLALTMAVVPAFSQTVCNQRSNSAPMKIAIATGSLSYGVTNATWATGTATLTIGANTLAIGNVVVVSGLSMTGGVTQSGYNGVVTLTGETATTISYALAVNPGGHFTASTGATVFYPGAVAEGVCISGVPYVIPLLATVTNVASVQPTMIGPVATFGTMQPIVCHAQWNYGNDGGAIGTFTPQNGCTIPANSAVVGQVVYNSTAAAGTSATLAIGWTGTNAALMTAATGAVANLSGTVALAGVIAPQTASTFVHTTSPLTITFTIGTAVMTAGVVDVYVFYIPMPV